MGCDHHGSKRNWVGGRLSPTSGMHSSRLLPRVEDKACRKGKASSLEFRI